VCKTFCINVFVAFFHRTQANESEKMSMQASSSSKFNIKMPNYPVFKQLFEIKETLICVATDSLVETNALK